MQIQYLKTGGGAVGLGEGEGELRTTTEGVGAGVGWATSVRMGGEAEGVGSGVERGIRGGFDGPDSSPEAMLTTSTKQLIQKQRAIECFAAEDLNIAPPFGTRKSSENHLIRSYRK